MRADRRPRRRRGTVFTPTQRYTACVQSYKYTCLVPTPTRRAPCAAEGHNITFLLRSSVIALQGVYGCVSDWSSGFRLVRVCIHCTSVRPNACTYCNTRRWTTLALQALMPLTVACATASADCRVWRDKSLRLVSDTASPRMREAGAERRLYREYREFCEKKKRVQF